MQLRVSHLFPFIALAFLLFSAPLRLFGADLTTLNKGVHARFAMLGYGPLCDVKVEERSANLLTVKLARTTSECGRKGEIIRVSQEKIAEIVPQQRLTKGRVVAKVLLGIGGVAALAAIPLNNSDPESWLVLASGVIPGFVVYGAWKAVPKRRDYLLLMTCPNRFHCFSDANRLPK